jgi:hypothetical protein
MIQPMLHYADQSRPVEAMAEITHLYSLHSHSPTVLCKIKICNRKRYADNCRSFITCSLPFGILPFLIAKIIGLICTEVAKLGLHEPHV